MAYEIISRKDARAQGLSHYFTGSPCLRGHIAVRWTANGTCFECQVEKLRAYAPTAKVKRLAWRSQRREALAAETRAWYAMNRDRAIAASKVYHAANKDRHRKNSKAWADKNRAKRRDIAKVAESKRRARMRGSDGTHTASDLAEILTAQGNRCAYCRADLRRRKKHVDHIVALACGGSNGRANLQYLCQPCNQSKSAKDPIDFAQSIGLLL